MLRYAAFRPGSLDISSHRYASDGRLYRSAFDHRLHSTNAGQCAIGRGGQFGGGGNRRELAGDMQAARIILDRLVPSLKPVEMPAEPVAASYLNLGNLCSLRLAFLR